MELIQSYAQYWWNKLQNQRVFQGNEKNRTWKKIRSEMLGQSYYSQINVYARIEITIDFWNQNTNRLLAFPQRKSS